MGEGPWEEGPFGSNQGTRVVVADGGGVQSAGGGGQDGNTFSPEICEGNNGANVAAWSSPEDPSIAASPPPPSHDPSAQQQQYAYQGNPSASFAASASPPERESLTSRGQIGGGQIGGSQSPPPPPPQRSPPSKATRGVSAVGSLTSAGQTGLTSTGQTADEPQRARAEVVGDEVGAYGRGGGAGAALTSTGQTVAEGAAAGGGGLLVKQQWIGHEPQLQRTEVVGVAEGGGASPSDGAPWGLPPPPDISTSAGAGRGPTSAWGGADGRLADGRPAGVEGGQGGYGAAAYVPTALPAVGGVERGRAEGRGTEGGGGGTPLGARPRSKGRAPPGTKPGL